MQPPALGTRIRLGNKQTHQICPMAREANDCERPSRRQRLLVVKWRTKRGHCNLLLLMLLLIAYEFVLHSTQQLNYLPRHQRCLPLLFRACSASASDLAHDTVQPQNRSSTITIMSSAPVNNTTTTTSHHHETSQQEQQTASNKTINKQKPQSHNVLCNSRCQCVILDTTSVVDEGQQPTRTKDDTATHNNNNNSSSSSKSDAASQRREPATATDSVAIEQSLIAFSEDYSLDYDQGDAPEQNDGNGLQQQQQQRPRPPTTLLNGTVSTVVAPVDNNATNQWHSGRGNSTMMTTTAPATTDPQTNNRSSTKPTTNPYAANNNVPMDALVGKRQPVVNSIQQPALTQLPVANMFPLPLHHLHHHLHHGGAGSAGRESSGPQLYAQSLYSSQAPKLSYHAHAPYLKTTSSSATSSMPSSAAASPSSNSLAQNLPDTPPPGGHHQRFGFGLKVAPNRAGKQLIKRLIPLQRLQMDEKLVAFKQNKTEPEPENGNKWFERRELAQDLAKMVLDIESQSIQSLSLRDNDLQFELWSELYALLASNLRQNLYHLDLSHNSLSKLALTFTGHLEHHLVVHGIWPFANSSAVANSKQQPMNDNEMNPFKTVKQAAGNKARADRSNRHQALLSDEKLYNLVREIIHNTTKTNDTKTTHYNNTLLREPMQLRALDLSHNKLKWLINDQFRVLKHVHTIRLDYNRIRYIHQHAFSGLESLRYLNLNFNRLQVIYIEQFQTNFNLLTLMLRSNFLAYLRGGAFASQVNLRRLDLSQNKLTIMSNNAFVGLESLELLNCSSNQFVHAPTAAFHPLTNLRQLDLSDNLIAQLAPGTFFHLPIEELWLERNEQLISIDRGAFWDLPYLRQLHLSSNPMLMNINQQAFVGSQNLQSIDINDCPSLDSDARRLLENVTMVSASRFLRYSDTTRQVNITHDSPASGAIPEHEPQTTTTTAASATNLTQTTTKMNKTLAEIDMQSVTDSSGSKMSQLQIASATANGKTALLKYFYYLATITSLVVGLKLVYKYTATSHFMETRRRRRRVYESNCDNSEFDSTSSSSSSTSYEMCSRPGNESTDQHVIGAVIHHSHPQSISDTEPVMQCASRRTSESSSSIFDAPEQVSQVEGELQHQQHQQVGTNEVDDINVISSSVDMFAHDQQQMTHGIGCCPDCPQQQQQQQQHNDNINHQTTSTIDLIHSQLVAAGFDYGHANCAHFYQSLGPALQLADMTANFVNGMDYY